MVECAVCVRACQWRSREEGRGLERWGLGRVRGEAARKGLQAETNAGRD
jgi:hypothetical protein